MNAWLQTLSHPHLFILFAGLFAIDMMVPDPVPLLDELLLGTTTLLLAGRKRLPQDDSTTTPNPST